MFFWASIANYCNKYVNNKCKANYRWYLTSFSTVICCIIFNVPFIFRPLFS